MDAPALTIASTSMDAWKRHKASWIGCQKCPLSKTRHNVVMLRGFIPAQVLFIGEAPGESEDMNGRPFVGPAGKLLDDIILDGWYWANCPAADPSPDAICPTLRQSLANTLPRMAVTNIVACIPITTEYNLRKPVKEEVMACRSRLFEIIDLVQPATIVTVGQIAKQFLPAQGAASKSKLAARKISPDIKLGHMIHPSAILRANGIRANLDYKRAVHTLSRLFKEL